MNDILFGNNNKSTLNLLTKRSLKARKNTIAVLAIMLATLLFTSLFTIAVSLQLSLIHILFITDLLDETASANALAIGIMGSSNSRYKNISEITAKLNSLYGANINVDIVKQGDFQKLCIGVTSIHNRYALEGEEDVYKRQGIVAWDLCFADVCYYACNRRTQKGYGIFPVSYTHLDVYKRQQHLW